MSIDLIRPSGADRLNALESASGESDQELLKAAPPSRGVFV